MAELTIERLQQLAIEDDLVNYPPEQWELNEMARQLLASMEQEPVAWLLSGGGAKNNVSFDSGNAYADPLREVTPLYTATPAPVSVPDGVLKSLLPDAEKSEFWFEHNGKILFEGVKFNNAVFDACRAAMLQAGNHTEQHLDMVDHSGDANEKVNSPVIPDGWVDCSERMPEDGQEVITHNIFGYRYVSFFDEHSGLFFDRPDGNQMNCIEHILVSHWRPAPAAPQQEVK